SSPCITPLKADVRSARRRAVGFFKTRPPSGRGCARNKIPDIWPFRNASFFARFGGMAPGGKCTCPAASVGPSPLYTHDVRPQPPTEDISYARRRPLGPRKTGVNAL